MQAPPTPEKSWKHSQILFHGVLKELETHFSALKVPYMPIKGAYLICCGLAGKMSYRRMDDIDIVVDKNDFEKVCDYLSRLPNVRFLKHRWYFEKEFSYSFGAIGCHLEIHWLLNFPARFDLPVAAVFHRALKSPESTLLLPCHEDAMLILVCHAFVHIAYELRETVFDEISLIASQEGFSWATFWEYARPTGIFAFIRLLLARYSKEKAHNVRLPPAAGFSGLLQPFLSKKWYGRMPVYVRKAVLELLFARNPWRLILNKIHWGN
jgi:hypothetical protein